MSRMFWVVVGAAGGIVAYRRGTRAAARAKELGPLGTAQVAAAATSRLAGRTANGLGHLSDLKARREGRLVVGSAEEATPIEPPVPADWVPVGGGPDAMTLGGAEPTRSTVSATPRTSRLRRDRSVPSDARSGI